VLLAVLLRALLPVLLLPMLLPPVLVLPATLLAMLLLRMPVVMLLMTALLVLLLRSAVRAALRRVSIAVETVCAFLAIVELVIRSAVEIARVLHVRGSATIRGRTVSFTAERRAVRIVRIELSSAATPPTTTTLAATSSTAVTGFAFLLGIHLSGCTATRILTARSITTRTRTVRSVAGAEVTGSRRIRRGVPAIRPEVSVITAARWCRAG
jgi:hypothetical protein